MNQAPHDGLDEETTTTRFIAVLVFVALVFLIYRVTGCAETGAPMMKLR